MDPVSKSQSISSHKRRNQSPAQLENLKKGVKFGQGQPTNAGGRPKKQLITKIYENIFNNAKDVDEIEDAIKMTLKSGRMAGVLLMREAAERLEGKVKDELELSGALNMLTDEQLEAKLQLLLKK